MKENRIDALIADLLKNDSEMPVMRTSNINEKEESQPKVDFKNDSSSRSHVVIIVVGILLIAVLVLFYNLDKYGNGRSRKPEATRIIKYYPISRPNR